MSKKDVIFLLFVNIGFILFEKSAPCSIVFCKISQPTWFSPFEALFPFPWIGAIVFFIPIAFLVLRFSQLTLLKVASGLSFVAFYHFFFASSKTLNEQIQSILDLSLRQWIIEIPPFLFIYFLILFLPFLFAAGLGRLLHFVNTKHRS